MKKTIETMDLDGGCTCLNFINTVHSRTEEPMDDYLYCYEDVIRWTRRTGILSRGQQQQLFTYATQYPGKAKNAFKKIITAREELYSLFYAITCGKKPATASMDYFNKLLPDALSHLSIIPAKEGMDLKWNEGSDLLLLPLWKVIKSAYDILLEEPLERIKACPGCLWLFLDLTKNNKRRWCNSLACGSIDKAMRYYYKKKEEKEKLM